MPRQQQLAQLATGLLQAARVQDWSALAAADRLLGQQLPQLAAQGAWSADERAILRTLEQAHGAALQACATARDALGRQLTQLQASRDGWLAYALQDNAAHEIQA